MLIFLLQAENRNETEMLFSILTLAFSINKCEIISARQPDYFVGMSLATGRLAHFLSSIKSSLIVRLWLNLSLWRRVEQLFTAEFTLRCSIPFSRHVHTYARPEQRSEMKKEYKLHSLADSCIPCSPRHPLMSIHNDVLI